MTNVIDTYSKLAATYQSQQNLDSCWGKITEHSLELLSLRKPNEVVVEVGCGPGIQMARVLEASDRGVQFIGIEPAENMRKSAYDRVKQFSNARILNGKFEELPLESRSVDYLYSIMAFHWVTDVNKSIGELSRVLKDNGEMDLLFSGRETGKELIRKTTPVYFRYLSPRQLMDAALARQRFTVDDLDTAFSPIFGSRNLTIAESFHTYYDSLEGHWSWWCRIEGQFVGVPQETKAECDRAVKEAIASLNTERGIPYTIHLLHVKVRC